VKIQSVTLPDNARVSSGGMFYDSVFRVVNNGSNDVRIYWEGNSSFTGKFDSGYITVEKNSYRDVKRSYYYTKEGTEEITYSLYDGQTLLDTVSATHYINP
jgi:hypothetical protein